MSTSTSPVEPDLSAFTKGLRARLLLLVLLAVVPAIGLIGYSAFGTRQEAIANAKTNALNLVQLVTTEQRRLITSTKQLLVSLSKLPDFKMPANAEACHRSLAQVNGPFSHYAAIAMAHLDGTIVCSSLPSKEKVNILDRGYFRRALQTRDFSIGDYQMGSRSSKRSINFGQAVLDDQGNVIGVVYAALLLSSLNQMITSYTLPAGSVLSVVDAQGTVLAATPDFENTIGLSIRDSAFFQTLMTHTEDTSVEMTGPDGEPRLYAFARLRWGVGGALYVVIEIPKTIVVAEANKKFLQNLLILLLVAVVVVAAAWIGSEIFVLRKMRQLATEVRQKTEEITRAKEQVGAAAAAKSRFFTFASHDLAQPVYVLSLLMDWLQRREKQKDKRTVLNQMRAALRSMESLFEGMLEISASEHTETNVHIESVCVRSLFTALEQEFKPIAAKKKLVLRFRSHAVALKTNRSLLERMLRNLIANAIKYTDRGGVLIACRPLHKEGVARLQVFDTGIGMVAEELPHIFEDFYRISQADASAHRRDQKRGGHGLGLGIVRRLAQKLDVVLEPVRSRSGRGTVFGLQIAIATEEPRPYIADKPIATAPLSLADRSILIVDDDVTVTNALRRLLLDWNAHVITATSRAVFEKVLTTLRTSPHFLIADYQLEPGFTGENVLCAVRQRFGVVVPCAIVTGNVSLVPPHIAHMERTYVLAKPVSAARLRALLHSVVPEP